MPLPHLLLVGAGHAHLYLLRQNALLKRFRITLVDPGGFWYSGLASGVLAGDHRPSEDRIDPALLCRQNGVDFIRARLVALDHEQQRGMLSNGSWLSFDYLSLNLGSAPLAPLPLHSTTKGSPHYWPVKPIPRLLQCRRSLERRFHHLPLSLHVLGAGASGIEVACATRALARRHGVADMALPIHLHHRGNGPLAQASAGAQRYVRDCLDRRAITLRAHPNAETTSLPPLVDDEASDIIDARGLAPPQNLTHLGLPTLAGRGIAVAADLRIDGSTTQFAAGDCARHHRPAAATSWGARRAARTHSRAQPAGQPRRGATQALPSPKAGTIDHQPVPWRGLGSLRVILVGRTTRQSLEAASGHGVHAADQVPGVTYIHGR